MVAPAALLAGGVLASGAAKLAANLPSAAKSVKKLAKGPKSHIFPGARAFPPKKKKASPTAIPKVSVPMKKRRLK